MKRAFSVWLCFVVFTVAGCATSREFGGEAPRMTVAELKGRLGSADLAVIDVRLDAHWEKSDRKIRGALRESPESVSWASRYPREKTLVLYCD